MIIHTVVRGDTIYSIGRKYGVSMQKIIDDNQLDASKSLVIGQTIVVITDEIMHTVSRGESLYSIARRYNTTVLAILDENPNISNPSMIYVGQQIIVPTNRNILGMIEVNGYAYPNINMNTLRQTLPNLTYLSIFSYEVRPDGSLQPIPDAPLIESAKAENTSPLMVITNIKEGGSFDSDLAHTILTNEQVQDNLLNNVVATLEKGYTGVDIDFEYIYPEDRENYNDFLRKVVDRLRPLGYTVSTAVAPKTSANQSGLLYEAHDYAAHGAIVDHVILMTYEWGYLYGPPMAVAPINQVERVVQYATSVIPNDKILLGIPNYGYDWTLPFVRGTAARTISNTEAVNLARQVGARIQYDTQAQAPFFNYYDNLGRKHVVWFEDARSIEAKLNLVDKYKLGGVSYWTIMNYFPQNWLVLNSMYEIKKFQ